MTTHAPYASLHGGVFERLRDMIIRCELMPGDRIQESELSQKFGVSRTPMREALKLLAAEGLIELRPHKGAVVADISPTEISEGYFLMGALEAISGPLVCERVSNIDLQQLNTIVEEMEQHLADGNLPKFLEANTTFHKRIVSLAGNSVLTQVYEDLFDKLQRARHLVSYDQKRWEDSPVEHRGIMDALLDRDGHELGLRLQEHVRRTSSAIIHKLGTENRLVLSGTGGR